MPAESESQRKAAAAAYQAKKSGKCKDLSGPAKQMCEGMSLKELEDYMKKKKSKQG